MMRFNRPSVLVTFAAIALVVANAAPGFAQGNSNHGNNSAAGAQGTANTNGRYSTDRDFGRDRAEERMSDRGLTHSQAGIRAETDRTNRDAIRIARLRADERANLAIGRANNHGANKAGFCPPGQAKKAGSGSHFNC